MEAVNAALILSTAPQNDIVPIYEEKKKITNQRFIYIFFFSLFHCRFRIKFKQSHVICVSDQQYIHYAFVAQLLFTLISIRSHSNHMWHFRYFFLFLIFSFRWCIWCFDSFVTRSRVFFSLHFVSLCENVIFFCIFFFYERCVLKTVYDRKFTFRMC